MHIRWHWLIPFFLTVTCPFPAAASTGALSADATRAIQFVSQGDYEQARETLRKAVAGRKDAPLHLAQLEGLILRRQGRDREAIEVFRFILSREPNFTPARIELSRALANLGETDASLHQLQVIELGSDDPEVRRQARAYGETVKSRRPYGFSGYVSLLPSTNLNRGSGQRTFKIGGMEFVIDDDSRGKSGWGVGTGGNAYRTFYLDQTTRLTTSGAIDIKKYGGGTDYDELSASTNLSLARRFGRLEIQAGPTMDYRLLAWEPYSFRYGAAVGVSYDLAARTRLYSGGTFLKQDFLSADYRDGSIFLGYAGIRHALSPSLSVGLTGNFIAERTKRADLDHNDFRLIAQVDKEWRGGFITSLALSAGTHDYRGEFVPGYGSARHDDVWSAGVTALNRNWSFQGFAPRFSYEYTRQKSNVSFYDYDSHDVDVTLTKLF